MSFPLYAPKICPPGWAPTFDASVGPCVLPQGDVSRARLQAGGSFFRSYETGATSNVNNISLSVTVTLISGNGTGTDVYDVVLNYTNADGVAQPPITVAQRYDNVAGSFITNGIDGMRAALTNNTIVTMPVSDAGSSGYTSANDADSMTPFSGLLSGGIIIPEYNVGIRTGPTFALFHVGFDDSAADGSQVEVNETKEWDGVNGMWIAHPSTLYKLDSNGNITPPPPCP